MLFASAPRGRRSEFRLALQVLDIRGGTELYDETFDAWDTDKSGGLNFAEIREALIMLQKTQVRSDLRGSKRPACETVPQHTARSRHDCASVYSARRQGPEADLLDAADRTVMFLGGEGPVADAVRDDFGVGQE